MTIRLSPRDRLVLTAGAVVVTGILLAGWGIPYAVRETAQRVDRANVAVRDADRVERAAHDATRLRETLVGMHGSIRSYDSALVAIGTPALASARLAEVIVAAATGSEARLGTTVLSVDSGGAKTSLTHVRAHTTLTGDLTSIALVIQSLESGPPQLAVRELTITRIQTASPAGHPEVLQAELVVEGLARRAGHEVRP
jgi:hypothetical protein